MAERLFHPHLILHAEDEEMWKNGLYNILTGYDPLKVNYDTILRVDSTVDVELKKAALEKEVGRLISEVGTPVPNSRNLILLGVTSGQIARTLIERVLPAAIVSDSGFPMNGALMIEWLQEHGLQNYPLIGLSQTKFERLSDDEKAFFGQGNARYICKLGSYDGTDPLHDALPFQIQFNMDFNRRIYGSAQA